MENSFSPSLIKLSDEGDCWKVQDRSKEALFHPEQSSMMANSSIWMALKADHTNSWRTGLSVAISYDFLVRPPRAPEGDAELLNLQVNLWDLAILGCTHHATDTVCLEHVSCTPSFPFANPSALEERGQGPLRHIISLPNTLLHWISSGTEEDCGCIISLLKGRRTDPWRGWRWKKACKVLLKRKLVTPA